MARYFHRRQTLQITARVQFTLEHSQLSGHLSIKLLFTKLSHFIHPPAYLCKLEQFLENVDSGQEQNDDLPHHGQTSPLQIDSIPDLGTSLVSSVALVLVIQHQLREIGSETDLK